MGNMKALDTLLSMASKRGGGKDVVRQAVEAVQELFTAILLPDRKLKYLEQQPLSALLPASASAATLAAPGQGGLSKDAERLLLYWYVEDSVKRRYSIYVTALEELSRDNLDFLKEKATKVMAELLAKKPEAETK